MQDTIGIAGAKAKNKQYFIEADYNNTLKWVVYVRILFGHVFQSIYKNKGIFLRIAIA
jgi:hypothetical protein